jgi:hypothetical protein
LWGALGDGGRVVVPFAVLPAEAVKATVEEIEVDG